MAIIFWFLFISVWVVVLIIVLKEYLFASKVDKSLHSSQKVFLLVKIKPTGSQNEENMKGFFQSLHHVLSNGTLVSFEISSRDQFLSFFIVVPGEYKNLLTSQIYAQFPDADIEETHDYLPDLHKNIALEELKFKHFSTAYLKSPESNSDDFLKSFSAILSKTEKDQEVFLQLSLRKVGTRFWNKSLKYWYAGLFHSKDEDSKFEKDVYEGRIRLGFLAGDLATAKRSLKGLKGIFKQFKSKDNELTLKRTHIFHPLDKLVKARLFETGDLWTPTELASIYHFPYEGNIVSNVVNTTSKHAPAPDILPTLSNTPKNEISVFGETDYRNERKEFGIKRADRRRHLYVIGKTGSGKTKLLEHLLISDIRNNNGCCIIDPHGDLADELLTYIPKDRINDVVYINPTDKDFPIGFNPLEPVTDYEERQHLSTFFIAIFKKLFGYNWNPRMEHLIRYITLALLETPDSNILGISRILSDTTFRQRVIKQIQDPVVKNFWANEFAGWNEKYSSEAVLPIINKIGQFIANPIVRNMVGQRENNLHFNKFMDEGKIVIINLSKGQIGDENTALLGSMFITKIQQAALARAKIPEEQRRDFYFYVDEFQNFATEAFSSILSEARKYHLNLTIAHQYIAQLPDDVKATAFGNVASIVAFAVGGDDAAYLAKEFTPTFNQDDMINLNTREMYIKMSIDGKVTPPFSAKTLTIQKSDFNYSIEIINHSRITYAKNRVAVENEINNWTNSTEYIDNTSGGNAFPEPII